MTIMGIPRPCFGVTPAFAGERAVLAARGEVDVFAAPMLGGFIDATIASGYLSVVVDLTDVEDMDAPAMAVIARAARRLAAIGGQLTVRTSALVARHISAIAGPTNWLMFEPTGGDMDDPVDGEASDDRGHLGEEESTTAPGTPAGDPSFGLVQALGHMSAVQADRGSWPSSAILSTPLLGSGQPIGALNIYSRTAEAFAPRDQELAAVFATEASIVLTDATSGASSEQLATRLGVALHTRQIIAQAQGVVMEREHISADAAYRLLANFSQSSNRPLLERAEDVVASTQHSPADRETEPVRILVDVPTGPAHKGPVEAAPPKRGRHD